MFCKRTSFIIFAYAFLTLSVYAYSQEQVSIGLNNVYVPKGFDANDSVEIVVVGELPNTCYLRPHGNAKIIGRDVIIEMEATKLSGPDVNCIMALVPYVVSVPLGQMNEGHYDIWVNAGTTSETSSSIFVERPNSNSINNFTYANVTNVQTSAGKDRITIEGIHPSSCMEISRVEIIPNEKLDTYSVLPIIKQTDPICDQMIKPFNYTIDLPVTQNDGVLVHIRKIDGTALNYLVKPQGKGKS